MLNLFSRLFVFFSTVLLILNSCGTGKNQVAEVISKPDSYAVTQKSPAVFQFEITEAGKYSFGLGVTYFNQQMQGFDTLKMHGSILGAPDINVEKLLAIVIKNEKGWVGEPQNEEKMDWLVQCEMPEPVDLPVGKFTFVLRPQESEKNGIPGMVELKFLVYKE